MDDLRRRFLAARQADEARNSLIEDLLQKVGDLQKQMDRHGFVMVLIDGDCMNFLDELVQQGIPGGEEAAKRLRRAVFEYLRYDEDFKHDYKIVIRVYANFRGLGKAYVDSGILQNVSLLADFVLGFNKAHPLCDFVDAGNQKEAADTKLKETMTLYTPNVHVKHILFGASADNGYASFLSSFFDTDLPSRLTILKGPPFSFEFTRMISKFRWTEFPDVFRGEMIPNQTTSRYDKDTSFSGMGGSSNHYSRPQTQYNSSSRGVISGPGTQNIDIVDRSRAEGFNATPNRDPRGNPETSPQRKRSDSYLHAPSQAQIMLSSSNNPSTADVVAALISSVNEGLEVSPQALDFGVVKSKAARKLGVTNTFWGTNEGDSWYLRSKNVMKWAVEDWIERTNSPPPKNATWMLRFFRPGRSPAEVIRSPSSRAWRTSRDPEIPLLELDSGENSRQQSGPNSGRLTPVDHSENIREDRQLSRGIPQNRNGQRIDLPQDLDVNTKTTEQLRYRNPRLCNHFHLLRRCFRGGDCPYDHDSVLTHGELDALRYLARSYRCPQESDCLDALCVSGHMCPAGRRCKYGGNCRFIDTHGIDTEVTQYATPSNV